MPSQFSVLLSLYKKENPVFLERALTSVFEQTYLPPEVVLVLDGEVTNELQAVVDEFKGQYPEVLKVFPLPKNVGLGSALNEGLKHCSYELVARMDTDDIAKPNRFERQIALFEQNPQIDVASAWIDEFYDSLDVTVSIRKVPETHEEVKRYAQVRSPLNHAATMYKKSKVLSVGGYNIFGLPEDYLLWMKMLKSGYIFYNIQESLLFVRTNRDMYKRRGGLKYAINECKLHWLFYQSGIISFFVMLRNIAVRFPVRLMPIKLRAFIYKKVLRSSYNQIR
jgi:glycosyltransferase involved in cell wall biosynthesis